VWSVLAFFLGSVFEDSWLFAGFRGVSVLRRPSWRELGLYVAHHFHVGGLSLLDVIFLRGLSFAEGGAGLGLAFGDQKFAQSVDVTA